MTKKKKECERGRVNVGRAELLQVIDVLSVFDTELCLNVDKFGVKSRRVDPAHVAMTDVSMQWSKHRGQIGNKSVALCFEAKYVKQYLASCGSDAVRVEWKDGRLTFSTDMSEFETKMYDPATISPDPKIPNLVLPYEFITGTKSMRRALKALGNWADHVRVQVDDGKLRLSVHADEIRSSFEVGTTKGKPCYALYPLEYIREWLRAFPYQLDHTIHGKFDHDYPMQLKTQSRGVDVMLLIAPRIEYDD